jgi:hypothetical protein
LPTHTGKGVLVLVAPASKTFFFTVDSWHESQIYLRSIHPVKSRRFCWDIPVVGAA